MSPLWSDVRHAFRMLRKTPGFTAVAVATLALGIGASTAMFTVLWNVVLRGLPYAEPAQLVLFSNSIPLANVASFPLSPPEFAEYRTRAQHSFAGLAGMEAGSYILTGEGEPERLPGTSVTAEFFSLMGVQPALGRAFVAEDYAPDAEPSIVISYGLWQRRFGGAGNILRRKLTINGRPRTVIGVMPRQFDFPEETQVWGRLDATPAMFTPQWLGRQQWRTIGRMKPGLALGAAQSEIDQVAPAFYKQQPQFYSGSPWKVTLTLLADQLLGNTRGPLLALAGAVGFLLLIACANVANLMLVRAEGRRRELAIRAAIGASRWQLVRQLLTESVLLATIGGVLGVLVAFWATDALLALVPGNLPRRSEITLDNTVLLFSSAVTLLTGLLFGLWPARSAARTDLQEWLREGSRSSAGGIRRAGNVLAATQIALSLVLLVGAGLLIRSLANVLSVSTGFEASGLVTFQLTPPGARYPTQAREGELYAQLIERVRTLPGVHSAAAVTSAPMSGRSHRAAFSIEGISEEQRGKLTNLNYRLATPAYFSTMGIPVLQGRDVDARDAENAPRVAVVNRTLAQRFWPGGEAIGKRISMSTTSSGSPLWHEIVGIVGDVRHMGLDADTQLEAFFPYAQPPIAAGARGAVMMVRASGDTQQLVASVRRELAALDPALPLYNVRTMEQQISASVATRRFPMQVLSFFAAVALLLAGMGIYGVLADSVARRTREIGVRMALGARRSDVFGLILRQGGIVIAAGVLAGLAGALAATRALRTLVFGVSTTDAATLLVVTLILCATAMAACVAPARRAVRVDPLVALRHE